MVADATQATVKTEASWSTSPDDTPVWVSVDASKARQESGTTSRGRSYEEDAAQAGTASWMLDNSDAAFTPGVGNITTDKRIRTTVTPPSPYDGTSYGIFDGYVQALAGRIDDAGFDNGRSEIKATDGFQSLSLIELLSAYDQAALALTPLAYYPLSESQPGAALPVAGDFTNKNASAALTYRGQTGGAAKFGGNAMLAADEASSVELSPVIAAYLSGTATYGGYQLLMPSTVTVSPAAGFTIVFALAANPATLPNTVMPLEQWGIDGLMQVRMTMGSNFVSFLLPTNASAGTYTSAFAQPDMTTGAVHLWALRLGADKRTMSLFMDGSLLATNVASSDIAFSASAKQLQFGSASYAASAPAGSGQTSTASNSWVGGRLSKIGVWNRPLTDAEIASLSTAAAGFPGEKAGARIARILDYAGWPASRRALDVGQSTTGPLLSAGKDALTLIQNVTTTEQGVTFIAGNGNVTFLDRARTRNTVSRVTLGTKDLPVEDDLSFDLDNLRVKNVIRASRPNGPTLEVRDAASVTAHRPRVYSVTYEVASDHELIDAASWELATYKNPRVRSGSVTLDPLTAPALWPWALGLEIGDRITITNLPSYAPATAIDYIIQSISHRWSVRPQTWRTTLQLSPPLPYATLPTGTLRADATPSAYTKLDAGLKVPY